MSKPTHEPDLGRIAAVIDDSSVWAEPPGEIEPALLASIVGSDRVDRVSAAPPSWRRWWGYAAAAMVAAVVAFILFAPLGGDDREPNAIIAMTGSGVEGEAAVGAADGGWWIQLSLTGLEPAPEGGFYEGWLSNGEDLVSVGTFHMRDGNYVMLWSGVPMRDFPELLVTLQELGAGTGPSSDVVVSGRLDG